MDAFDKVKAQLVWVCDALIPADEARAMPSATGIGMPDKHLPIVLKGRSDLAPTFIEILSGLPAARPADPIGTLEALPEGQIDLLGRLIAAAYFADPVIGLKIGYWGQRSLPLEVDYDDLMNTVQPVMDRGPVFIKI